MKKLHDLTLLYVEDDFDAQVKMQLLLEDEVKDLYQAFNGADALEFYYNKQPDIIITDINMPYMDGLSFAQRVKEINENQPIIIISGYDNKENLLQSINIGVDQFLQKPIDMELLFQKIEATMRKAEKTKEKDRMAYYDSLTGIYNRHFFDKALNEANQTLQNNKTAFSLVVIDLDNFKTVNDNYGHCAGDQVIQKLTSNIKTVLHKDDIFARIGGDEFAIITQEVNEADSLHEYAQNLCNAANFSLFFDEEHSVSCRPTNDKPLSITCSIGICNIQNFDPKKNVLQYADIAMYKTKNRGKAHYTIEYI